MMRRVRRERNPLNAEINVVSLIDVMMLLLVIFMITAPMLQGGLEIKLPKGEARPLEGKADMVVTVRRGGRLGVDRVEMTWAQFEASFPSLAERRGKRGVILQAEADVPHGDVVRALGVMVKAGVEGVGIAVDPVRR
ncbi:MAG: biopolymer transporter ExbD [Gemmatimonadetes bacterium]|nr:biopolymer transporter ExbD [Gemmatimonadota bacterium]